MSVDTCVLLAVHNGEKYLKDQLQSLMNQAHQNFDLWILNDASQDNSVSICRNLLKDFSGNVFFLENVKALGPTKAFEKLLLTTLKSENNRYKYFLFCDQDDIWSPKKIEIQIEKLQRIKGPALVHSDLSLINSEGNFLFSSLHKKMGFKLLSGENLWRTLITQNVITGCSLALNRELAEISLPIPDEALMHDHWIGLVASFSGSIIYQPQSLVSYRQHSTNASGGLGERSFFKKIANHLFFPNKWRLKIKARWAQNRALENFLISHPKINKFNFQRISEFQILLSSTSQNSLRFLNYLFKFKIKAQGLVRTMSFYLGSLFWRRKTL